MMNDEDDELFLWYGWSAKGVYPYFQSRPLSEILTIVNLWHVTSRIWTCTEPEFRLRWMKLCSSDNHYTINTTLHHHICWLNSIRASSSQETQRIQMEIVSIKKKHICIPNTQKDNTGKGQLVWKQVITPFLK